MRFFQNNNSDQGKRRQLTGEEYEVDPQRVAEAIIVRLVTGRRPGPAGLSGPSHAGAEVRQLRRAA